MSSVIIFLTKLLVEAKYRSRCALIKAAHKERDQSEISQFMSQNDRKLGGKVDRSTRTTKLNVAGVFLIRFASAQQHIVRFGVDNMFFSCCSLRTGTAAAAATATQPIVTAHHPGPLAFRQGQADRLDCSHIHHGGSQCFSSSRKFCTMPKQLQNCELLCDCVLVVSSARLRLLDVRLALDWFGAGKFVVLKDIGLKYQFERRV
jgi:hypothetical protein